MLNACPAMYQETESWSFTNTVGCATGTSGTIPLNDSEDLQGLQVTGRQV